MNESVGRAAAIRVVADAPALADAALAEVLALANEAVGVRGAFRIALAGGSSPRTLYERLANAAGQTDFTRWEVLFGDERWVPAGSRDSNFGMASEALLDRVPIPRARVHRMRTDLERPEDAASAYQRVLARVFGVVPGAVPRFDLVLLGLGADGHTASLFPGTAALGAGDRLVAANWVQKLSTYRVTLTARVINAARHVMFLVAGPEKAAALTAVLAPDGDPNLLPARLIAPTNGLLTWLVDRAASGGRT